MRRAASGHPRIGNLSSNFHNHAAPHLVAGLLELHDRGEFEIYAYQTAPQCSAYSCEAA
ncbi:MAG: hypothetical protein WC383_15405 [Gammaproteobacteria bacterium]